MRNDDEEAHFSKEKEYGGNWLERLLFSYWADEGKPEKAPLGSSL